MPLKQSKRALAEKKRREQEDLAFARKLKQQIESMSRSTSGKPVNQIPKLSYRDSSHTKHRSAEITPLAQVVQIELSPEMAEREEKAQLQMQILKGRVAPLFNKGAYQFITDGTDLTTLGR